VSLLRSSRKNPAPGAFFQIFGKTRRRSGQPRSRKQHGTPLLHSSCWTWLEDFNKVFASRAADIILTVYPLSFVALGYITDNKELAVYGWKATEAALNALIVTVLVKKATLRARPHTGDPYGFWEGGNSFPSGHAAISWAIAAYSAKHFSDKKWVRWVAYPIAGLITFVRVTSGNHFVSDAVTGSMIGFSIGRFVVK